MTVELRDRIVADPEILGGKPAIKGTRISVELILGHLAAGWSLQNLLESYPHITQEDIRACLAYAHDVVAEEVVVSSAA